MRVPPLILAAAFAASCEAPSEMPPAQQKAAAEPAANLAEPPPGPPTASDDVANEAMLSLEPPADPAFAAMSAGQRREYDRGYRDCIRGRYDYDPERQGESYRIGCMAAENARSDADR